MDNLDLKLAKIRNIKDFSYLLNERQDYSKIVKYYQVNRLPYLLFHNRHGYLHMGISQTGKYKKSDLLGQLEYIEKNIIDTSASDILELGYGQGANMNYLAKKFPAKKFVGIDISTNPLKRFKLNKNATFIKGDYHDLKKINKKFDLVYAIETLCHSNNLAGIFQEISSVMNEGALLIVFDGYSFKNKTHFKDDINLACSLVEKSMAVNEFHSLDDFKIQAEKAGLFLLKEIDFSQNILPTLNRFESLARRYIKYPIAAWFVNHIFPEIFVRNFLSGYLMPDLIKLGVAGYYMNIFYKK